MMTAEKKHKAVSFVDVILFILLLCAVGYIGFFIFTRMNPYTINSDTIAATTYRQLAWEQKTLFPKDFYYPVELYASHEVILYGLIYGLTGNFMLSLYIDTFICFLFQLAALWYLLGRLKIGRRVRLLALCMYAIWLPAEAKYVLFRAMNDYTLFPTILMLSLALRVDVQRAVNTFSDLKKRGVWVRCGLMAGLNFISLFTVRFVWILYLPLFFIDVVTVVIAYIRWKKISDRQIVIAGLNGALMLMGGGQWLIMSGKFKDYLVPAPSGVVDTGGNWINGEAISNQIETALGAMGLRGGGQLTSSNGILFLVSGSLLLVGIISVLYLIINESIKIKHGDSSESLVWYWLAVTMTVFATQVLRNETAKVGTYYFPVSVFFVVVCAEAIERWIKRTPEETKYERHLPLVLVTGLLSVLFVANVDIEMTAMPRMAIDPLGNQVSEMPTDLSRAAMYMKNNGYKYVTASFWNSGVIKGYTNGAVENRHSIDSLIYTLTPNKYLIDGKVFEDECQGEPNILLLTDTEEAEIIAMDGAVYHMMVNYSTKVAEFGEYNLYAFTENPYTLVKKVEQDFSGGLPLNGQEKTVTPKSTGFIFLNSSLNEAGELVSDGTAGCIMYGPYTDSVAGVYDITLNYAVDSCVDGTTGTFDIGLDNVLTAIASFSSDCTSVVLKNVQIDEGHYFEARVCVPEGMIMRVISITYTPVAG